MGLVVLSQLAARGAQIIALTPNLGSPRVQQLVQLLRDSSDNQLVYAEQCDVLNPHSVTNFAETWNKGATAANKTNPLGSSGNTGEPGGLRLDAMIFLPLQDCTYSAGEGLQRVGKTDAHPGHELAHAEIAARYHFVQSMLSILLMLPPDRDIRIISAISPWHPAGLAAFDAQDPDWITRARERFPAWQPWCATGAASLRWLALSAELQRRIQLLAEADNRPRGPLPAVDPMGTAKMRDAEEVQGLTKKRANINVINVCVGFERNNDILAYLLPPAQPEPALSLEDIVATQHAQQEAEGEGGEEKVSTAAELSEELKASLDPRRKMEVPRNPFRAEMARARYGAASTLVRYALAVLLWPLVWLFAKAPGRAANGITWALVAPIERPSFGSREKQLEEEKSEAEGRKRGAPRTAKAVRPVALYKEGLPRPITLPAAVQGEEGQRKIWEAEEAMVKASIRPSAQAQNAKQRKKR